jgi:subtilisin-like proprotein convertase family protein
VLVSTGAYTITGDATDLARGSNIDFLFETTDVAALSVEGANALNKSAAGCGFSSWQAGISRSIKGSCDAQAYYTTGLVPFDRLALIDGKITLGSYVLYNNEGMTLEHRPEVYTQGEDLAKITEAQIQESTSAPQPAAPGTKLLNLHDKSAPTAIPDGTGSIERTFTVDDSGTLTEIGLYVDISHRYGSDVRVSLRTPTGAVINLPTQSSSGAYSVRRWGAGGSPVTDLSNLWGTQVKGVWTVVVKDVSSSDSGTLNGLDLTIRFK